MKARPKVPQLKSIKLHRGDLPEDVAFHGSVAVDTETMGLDPNRDRLCLVQLSGGDGVCHIVQIAQVEPSALSPVAPNLAAVMGDESLTKIYHFARFDLATMRRHLGVLAKPVFCTKIASRLTRTYTDRHSLKDLCKELLGVDLSKQQQSSDWGAAELTEEQLTYAASDVLYLHALRERLDDMLAREGRSELAEACFRFLPARALLDLAGWAEQDIFEH
ncbi:MAG: ribonuclease H-like domain-containing protein [Alphaproteobacteria bacterium]